jgi:hypothetical protein
LKKVVAVDILSATSANYGSVVASTVLLKDPIESGIKL